MQARLNQQPSKIDQRWSIQLQSVHRRSASGCESLDHGPSFCPLEVLVPLLRAWIKERDETIGKGIRRSGFRGLAIITALARQRQVLRVVGASPTPRRDMFGGKRIGNEAGGCETILAPITGALCDETARAVGLCALDRRIGNAEAEAG